MSAEASKDLKSKLKAIWKDPVWSKVISVAIVAVLASIWATVKGKWPAIGKGLWSGLTWVWAWLGSATSIWNWLLLVFIAVALFVLYVVIRLVLEAWNEQATLATFRDYLSDSFEGMHWHWRYNAVNQIIQLYPCCPVCQMQLEPKRDHHRGPHEVLIHYRCETCNERKMTFTEYPEDLEGRVKRKIERKLRTGDWEKVVEQQRKAAKK